MAKPEKVDLKKGAASPKESANEVWTLVRDYAKQETVDPLKGLGSFLKYGLAGALLLGIAAIELAIALMRLLQAEAPGVFDGRLSFLPYLITLVVTGLVLLWVKKGMSSKKSPVA